MATTLAELVQGTRRTYLLTVTRSGSAVDLTGTIIRWMAKRHKDAPNSEADIARRSYDNDEIDIFDPVNGRARLTLNPEASRDVDPGRLCFGTEVTEVGSSITNTGTLAVTADPTAAQITLTGTGVDFSGVEEGDVLVPSGAQPGNDVRCIVEEVDATNGTITTDYVGWATESGFAFEVFRGLPVQNDSGEGILPIGQATVTEG